METTQRKRKKDVGAIVFIITMMAIPVISFLFFYIYINLKNNGERRKYSYVIIGDKNKLYLGVGLVVKNTFVCFIRLLHWF